VRLSSGSVKASSRRSVDQRLEGVDLSGGDSTEIDEDLGADVAVDALATGEASVGPARLSDEVEVEVEAAGHTGPKPGLSLNYTTRNDIRLYYTTDSPRSEVQFVEVRFMDFAGSKGWTRTCQVHSAVRVVGLAPKTCGENCDARAVDG
jgi:hypothetical protein